MTTLALPKQLLGSPERDPCDASTLHLKLPRLLNEQGEPMRLLLTWLFDAEREGEVLYAGTGGAPSVHTIAFGAGGYRLRRWPSEGLAPEYFDWWFDGSGGRR